MEASRCRLSWAVPKIGILLANIGEFTHPIGKNVIAGIKSTIYIMRISWNIIRDEGFKMIQLGPATGRF